MKYLQEFSHSKKQREIPPFQNVPYRTETALKTATLFGGSTLMIGTVVEIRLVQKGKKLRGVAGPPAATPKWYPFLGWPWGPFWDGVR